MQAVLIKKNADQTVEIIKRGGYPNLDIEPIQGLDPDLEWLLVYKPFVEPEYDPRIYVLQQIEDITSTPHPDYPFLNQFRVTYLPIKRQSEEIQEAVANAESLANENLVPYDKRLKLLVLAVAVLLRKTEGLALTNKEKAISDQLTSLATKMWKNDANAMAKAADIISGLEPDLDAAWEKE